MALDPQIVDRALAEATKRTANLDYFFDNLTSPEWIDPLFERKLFSEPPEQTVDDQGYVRAPGWAATRYLARVAGEAPERVVEAIQAITTGNERVHEDFVDAALAMPPESARRVALDEAAWIRGRERLFYLLPRKVVDLVAQLAGAGEVGAATALVLALFSSRAEPRETTWGLLQAEPRFTDWEYDLLLRKVVEGAVPAAPSSMLEALISVLENTLELIRPRHEDGNEPRARPSWRVRIADDRSRGREMDESLISAVRDAARLIRHRELMDDVELVSVFTSQRDELFRRIVMDALTRPPEPDPVVVRPFVVDPDEFADPEPSPEFRELLRANALQLGPDDLAQLLAVVVEGPNVERYRDVREKFGTGAVTDEEIEDYIARWRVGRLKLLLPALSEDWVAKYEALAARVGEVEIPISGDVTEASFTGEATPFSVSDLESKTDDELLTLLRQWEPEDRWDAPSVEGLARAMAAFTQAHPDRMSRLANELRDVRPAYLQWILEGFQRALGEGARLQWEPVLELLGWIAEQPREIPGGRRDRYGDLDPGWVWTRRAVASLLESGFTVDGDRAIPSSQRDRVWRAISAIADDPDPTPHDEERLGGSNMDPVTLSLNTTRPRAIGTAIRYARWVYRFLEAESGDEKLKGALFSEAPEVPELLDRHLDPAVDPSPAVRSVFGLYLAELFVLDTSWVSERAGAVFPQEDTRLREAAWGAYVIYTPPYNDLLPQLRTVYARSAELLGGGGHGFAWSNGDPRSKLGEHLATFYLRGLIALDDELFTPFWRNSRTPARADLVEFVGRQTRGESQLELDVQDRLSRLWTQVVDEADRHGSVDELTQFASWFAARGLPLEWRFEELIKLLERDVSPEPAFIVAEELTAAVEALPRESVRALRLLLEKERDSWAISSLTSEIETVLRKALDSDDAEARTLAEETTNWLGALGYRNFGALLH